MPSFLAEPREDVAVFADFSVPEDWYVKEQLFIINRKIHLNIMRSFIFLRLNLRFIKFKTFSSFICWFLHN